MSAGQTGEVLAWLPQYPSQTDVPDAPPARRGWIVAVVTIVVVLVAACVVGAAVLTNRQGSSTASPGAATHPPLTLSAPDQIGSLRKQTDQSRADKLRTTMTNGGMEQPFAVVYEDAAAPGRETVVWGGTGGIFAVGGRQAQLDSFFSSAAKQLGAHATLGPQEDVDPGSVGGTARCSKVDGLGVILTLCGWLGQDAFLAFLFYALTPDTAAKQLDALLPAIVGKT